MKVELFNCSPQAKAKIESYEDKIGLEESAQLWAKYPWGTMKIGDCFCLPFAAGKERSLRTSAAQQKAKTGKVYAVIKHKDLKIFEVARIG